MSYPVENIHPFMCSAVLPGRWSDFAGLGHASGAFIITTLRERGVRIIAFEDEMHLLTAGEQGDYACCSNRDAIHTEVDPKMPFEHFLAGWNYLYALQNKSQERGRKYVSSAPAIAYDVKRGGLIIGAI